MNLRQDETGKVKIGLIVFIVLLAAVIGRYTYKYLDKATRLNDEAIELMNAGKYDSALAKLDEAVAEKPEYIPGHYHRGICLAEKHMWDDAVIAFNRVIELDPQEGNAHFNKGKVYWAQEEFEEALRHFEKATEHQGRLEKPNRDTVWRFVGECYYEMYMDKLANDPEDPGAAPPAALMAFKTYLQDRPGALDRRAIAQKIEILEDLPENLDKYKEIIEKRKKSDKKKTVTLEELKEEVEKTDKQGG